MKHWSNWSGSVIVSKADFRTGIASDRLADLIGTTTSPIRPAGTGHSFTPLVGAENALIVKLAPEKDTVSDGPVPGSARISAGAVLKDITAALHSRGQALSNMGDIDDQTFGGALATATHGTGLGFGCYSSMLQSLALVDGRGRQIELDRKKDDAAFHAMAVGLGTGGIVTSAVVHTAEPYRLERHRFAVPVDALIDDFRQRMTRARNVEFFYITGSGMALVLESEESKAGHKARPEDKDQEGLRQLRLAGRLLGRFPKMRRALLGFLLKGHAKEHFVEDWHLAFPSDRSGIRFNECEYHLPIDAAPEALRRVINCLEHDFPDVYFPLEVRTVGSDDLWLSPFYKRDSVSIAVHHEAGKPFDAILNAVEAIFRDYDGRPHWGKMHTLAASDLQRLYPRFREAVEVRRELDPDNRFVSPYIAGLLGL